MRECGEPIFNDVHDPTYAPHCIRIPFTHRQCSFSLLLPVTSDAFTDRDIEPGCVTTDEERTRETMIEDTTRDLWRIEAARASTPMIDAIGIDEAGHRFLPQRLKELKEVTAHHRFHAPHLKSATIRIDHRPEERQK